MTCDNCAKLKEQSRLAQAEAAFLRKAMESWHQENSGPEGPTVWAYWIDEEIGKVLASPGPGAKMLAVVNTARNAICGCTGLGRDGGHVIGCWMPRLIEALRALDGGDHA